MAFQANLPKFEAANCAVVGCSNDPVEKNTEFATKEGFAYPLLCDTEFVDGNFCLQGGGMVRLSFQFRVRSLPGPSEHPESASCW